MTTTTKKTRKSKKSLPGTEAEIRVRIDVRTKEKAEKILKRLGMSASEAVRIFMAQTVEERGLPFQPRTLDAESRRAIEESLAGKGQKVTMAEHRKIWDEA